MKRLKWKNIMIALIFILSIVVILVDSAKIILGYSYTAFGAMTGLIAIMISLFSYEYLEAEMEK
jgi:hypothetical protein